MSFSDIVKQASVASLLKVGDKRGQILSTPAKNNTANKNNALVSTLRKAAAVNAVAKAATDSGNSGRVAGSSMSGIKAAASNLSGSVKKATTAKKVNTIASVNDLANQNISGTMYEDIANKNNQINIQMNRENNAFNAQQAELQRAYEERLANTAHQREVADLKAAGLNPILSAGGTGAVTPSGANAAASNFTGTDNSIVSALAGLAANAISANATMTAASTNAAATQAAASMTAGATMAAASMNAEAQKYASDNAYKSSVYQSDMANKNSVINQAGNVLSSIVGAYGLSKAAGITRVTQHIK